jgi:D-serine deaminase-like pyridoxal phosphate-dependent protein
MKICDLPTPSFLVDLGKLENNIAKVHRLAKEHGRCLWPMTKTHKSTDIARLQMAAGVDGFLAGTLDEARSLAKLGVPSVAYAYPLANPRNIASALEIFEYTQLVFSVDSLAMAKILNDALRSANLKAEVLVIIDSGLHRFGIQPHESGAFFQSLAAFEHLAAIGISTHPGQVYACEDDSQVLQCVRQEQTTVADAIKSLALCGFTPKIVASGSTPTYTASLENPQITVQRPGNYVFFDRMQHALGACSLSDCALTVLATVISNPSPGKFIIDAGSKAFGLDKGAHGVSNIEGFGYDIGHPELSLSSLSEEVGIIMAQPGSSLSIGDKLRLIPNHACSVANLSPGLVGCRDDNIECFIEIDMRRTSGQSIFIQG